MFAGPGSEETGDRPGLGVFSLDPMQGILLSATVCPLEGGGSRRGMQSQISSQLQTVYKCADSRLYKPGHSVTLVRTAAELHINNKHACHAN